MGTTQCSVKIKKPADPPLSLDQIGADLEAQLAAETGRLEERSIQRTQAVSNEQESAASVASGQRRLRAYQRLEELAVQLREDTPGTEKAIIAIEGTRPKTAGELTRTWFRKARNLGIAATIGIGIGMLASAYNSNAINTNGLNLDQENLGPEALQNG